MSVLYCVWNKKKILQDVPEHERVMILNKKIRYGEMTSFHRWDVQKNYFRERLIQEFMFLFIPKMNKMLHYNEKFVFRDTFVLYENEKDQTQTTFQL